ncbi:hypothetical protein ACHAW6_001509 [Cyclotella cf. meneghiniana]
MDMSQFFMKVTEAQWSMTTTTLQSPAQSLPFSKGAEMKTDSEPTRHYAIQLGTTSTTSAISPQLHIWYDTSMQHSVSPLKMHYSQQFATAISPHFRGLLQPTS